MILKRTGVALVLALAAGAVAAQQQLYRWTDEKGQLHVADTPPPPGAKDVHRWRVTASSAAEGGSEPYALRQARKESPVTLYTAPDCDPCDDARKLLNARGIPFKEVSVTEKEVNDVVKLAGSASVPLIVVGSATQKGFEESAFHRLLDDAGYPKVGILAPRSQKEPKPGAQEAAKPASAEEPPRGPYAPGAPPQRSQSR
jgi:glutaredoxin